MALGGVVQATTWSATGSIEMYENTQTNQVNANGLSKAKAEMISPQHANAAKLIVHGSLYRYATPNDCAMIEQLARSSCQGQKIIGSNSSEVTCGTADAGQCSVRWALRSTASLWLGNQSVGREQSHWEGCQFLGCSFDDCGPFRCF